MVKIELLLFCVVFLLTNLVFLSNGLAILSCGVKNAACDPGEVAIFKTSFITNAHAELPSQTNYMFNVCCGGVTGIGNSCSGNYAIALNLSSATNAHVEENTPTNPYYPYSACVSNTNPNIIATCNYATDCSSLGTRYACLVSISDETNAHVGTCDVYPRKVCCTMLPPHEFDVRAVTKVIGTVGEQLELKVEITNTGALQDIYNVTVAAASPNIVDISNPKPNTTQVQPEESAPVSILIRPLTDEDNAITIKVVSYSDPLIYKEISISLRSAKLSLPEFGLIGFLQIIAISAVAYFFFVRGSKANSQ